MQNSPDFQKKNNDNSYFVLARKYRPINLDDLVGQEVLVRTLKNSFIKNRIAQAYMLTGIRGIGKTSTARIIARILNYENKNKQDKIEHLNCLAQNIQPKMERV